MPCRMQNGAFRIPHFAESRAAWRATADRSKSALFDIEVVCSDPIEHRRRVEARIADGVGSPRRGNPSSSISMSRGRRNA
jgi:hypothetical protein